MNYGSARRSVLRPGPLFQFPLRMKSNVVRAYFAQLHHPTRYGRSLGTLDRRATRRFTFSTFFIKNIPWCCPRRIRCPDVSRWTKTVEKTMFGAVLEKNIRHAYRRPQTRKIELSTPVFHIYSPIVLFQTWLNIFTAPELVGLWLGSVEIQQAIYRAYEFVTCYDRCTLCTSIIGDLYPVWYSTPEKWGTEKRGIKKRGELFHTPCFYKTLRNNLDKYQVLVCYSVDSQLSLPLQ